MGQFSKKWEDAQEEWPGTKDWTCTPSTAKWGAQVTEEMLKICWNMWEHRNHIPHSEENPRCDSTMKCLNKEVEICFRRFREENFLSEDTHPFRQGSTKVKERSVEEKRIWLLSIGAAEARKKSCNKRCQSREERQDTRRFPVNNTTAQTRPDGVTLSGAFAGVNWPLEGGHKCLSLRWLS